MTELLAPAYHARSLGDVVPAVGVALGLPGVVGPAPCDLTLPEAPAYVVLLVDGMGATLLERHAHLAPFLAGLRGAERPLTAGVPSTTATSLTSLGTGLTPGEHGMVGYTCRNPENGELFNALLWDSGVDPVQWQPHPTAFDRLVAAGASVAVVNKREFNGSGLTVAAHRGAEFVGADKAGERITQVVEHARRNPSLTYVYDGDLDWTGHRYGVDSPQWRQQLRATDAEAAQLREALPPEVRLLVVADHGMVDVPPSRQIDVDEHPHLRQGLTLFAGEARFRHLYCQDGAVGDVQATWQEFLGQRATVLTRQEATRAGWFGTVTDPVAPRLGDIVVAAHDSHAIFSSLDFPYEMTLRGLHGSLTPDEMLIPLLLG